ncbi:hypothetical protein DIPPA_28126 [Diplonema papillatum]|nr:hypothetical protein DIPPA_33083 [Diplonema papillatum]KAJ9439298.1 hypothetical protein DIPPA_00049 [Diplonema papillatum]KAJ9440970.1 hypothetical protein DIPPA_12760 [Diplonema papillatum]KAJ9441236.1 hypothetical protein DIPPA_12795 [Diplonema papillatum]KAJ9442783.1 hypothetical protein DIPPA_32124 [Diplonema papillatum]
MPRENEISFTMKVIWGERTKKLLTKKDRTAAAEAVLYVEQGGDDLAQYVKKARDAAVPIARREGFTVSLAPTAVRYTLPKSAARLDDDDTGIREVVGPADLFAAARADARQLIVVLDATEKRAAGKQANTAAQLAAKLTGADLQPAFKVGKGISPTVSCVGCSKVVFVAKEGDKDKLRLAPYEAHISGCEKGAALLEKTAVAAVEKKRGSHLQDSRVGAQARREEERRAAAAKEDLSSYRSLFDIWKKPKPTKPAGTSTAEDRASELPDADPPGELPDADPPVELPDADPPVEQPDADQPVELPDADQPVELPDADPPGTVLVKRKAEECQEPRKKLVFLL